MKRTQLYFWDILAKGTYPESNHEKTSDKLMLRDRLRNNYCNLQKCKGHESQRKIEELFQMKEAKKTWQLNVICDSEPDAFFSKRHFGKMEKNLNEAWGLHGGQILM